MDVRELDRHDETALRRFWEVGVAAERASRPYDFSSPWESARRLLTVDREDVDHVLLGAFDDAGVMWGAGQVELRLLDNLHAAVSLFHVHPERERRGFGRALAEAAYDVVRRRDRRLLVTETYAPLDDTSAGLLFAEAMGFTTALVDQVKVVDLPSTEPLWDALAAGVAPRHAGYRVFTWGDALPEEHVDGYCRLIEQFLEQAPMGRLEVERETWDETRVRSRERRYARIGRRAVSAGALTADGTLVGVTEVAVSVHAPHWGMQSGTLVEQAHRGHGLGLAIKIANHRRLREHFPDCRVLVTGNADVNAAMNAVNDALGYRQVERCLEMQRAL